MSVAEILQFTNLLIVPALGYVIALERRIMRLETMLAVKLDALPCQHGGCFVNHRGDKS